MEVLWRVKSCTACPSLPLLYLSRYGEGNRRRSVSVLISPEFMPLECEAFACSQHIPCWREDSVCLFSITAWPGPAFDPTLRQSGEILSWHSWQIQVQTGYLTLRISSALGLGLWGETTGPVPPLQDSCYSPRGAITLWKAACMQEHEEAFVKPSWPPPETCFKFVPCGFFIKGFPFLDLPRIITGAEI